MNYAGPVLLIAALILPGCGDTKGEALASADLKELGGSGVTGKVTFTRMGKRVTVNAVVNGLTPGKHGFHVHEFGDCSSPDGKSAGDHFNPLGHAHGGPGSASHMGDLGNLEADATGKATLMLDIDQLTVDDGTLGVVGRGLIVHEKPDDLTSQPVGNAGERVACAVIESATGETKPVLATTK